MNSYEMTIAVTSHHIDENGHVNNIEYLKWMQEIAIAHSDAVGCSEAALQHEATWYAREHKIRYLRPAFEGDSIRVKTWVDSFQRVSSLRKYQFVHEEYGKILAEASTMWVFVDCNSGRLLSIPDNIKNFFE
ncbi:MAG: acyl-CoA thioesterase [Thermodesulfobacteriota bacterium]|nr:acyl-CoA thioesterase [Thermodesulfobacteriota bacterium]